MITASNELKDLLEQQSTLIINSGCTLEYNMNLLVDSISVTGATISRTDAAGNQYFPFKKLFPIDTVIKPNRPINSGIKYAIVGDISQDSYRNPKSTGYPINYRTYLPGTETTYKYYLSDKGVGLDVTATYSKTILTNKIVVRFELAHSTPATWSIYNGATQIASGTNSNIVSFGNSNSGSVTIYYNGTSWSTTEPSTISAPVSMTSLRVVTGGVSGKYTGLIEMSPRWVKDISDRITQIDVRKETSTGSEEILPVGALTANSLSAQLVSYEDPREVLAYDKTLTLDASKIYLFKGIELIPYFKIYHSAGTLSDSGGTYEKIKQGNFYIDSFYIEEFGDISVTALDGARILQNLTAPSIVCKEYSALAIIRTLLDNCGFTNYNFNYSSTDSSIFSPRYWWTDDNSTVWDSLQQLCRDSQMTAVFDENNILQFYTREYLFNSTGKTPIPFRYAASGNNLPNILSLSKSELPSANQAKVVWNSVATNNYVGNSQPLWSSAERNLGALSIEETIPAVSGHTVGPYDVSSTPTYMKLSLVVDNDVLKNPILNEYSGYLIIDSEVIEYDAIQYEYVDLNGSRQTKDISNGTEALKYLGLSKAGSGNYQPNGYYRIKTRGAFETKITSHGGKSSDVISAWSGYDCVWDEKGGTAPVLTNSASITASVSNSLVPNDSALFEDPEWEYKMSRRMLDKMKGYL